MIKLKRACPHNQTLDTFTKDKSLVVSVCLDCGRFRRGAIQIVDKEKQADWKKWS